ncbi:PP2C family protein-serine/threonine phosphatase [Jidongwangia harbinensis]|uniref:PP2C family protein-serine/threonine phosphatase n=1 Tax=Jidongwangia harbinensis TaxID=2878561 RepID=UPI001CD9FD26|nr:PP2C family protein-serine/threonine phosphatase [Jidongwangia harbinensis]MCA2213230.1 serine/threonine-protein phosphatase [Jidongwangia harbinensis]
MEQEPDLAEELRWDAAVVDLIRRTQLAQPDELVAELNAAVRPLGIAVTVYLVDHEQEQLWPLPERGKPTPPALSIDGSLAGRCFTGVRTYASRDDIEPYRLWVPMVDGSERLGIAEVVAQRPPADAESFRRRCETLMGLLGHLVAVKSPYGDSLHRVRRTRPMSPAAELMLHLLPPLTFSCHRMVISAVLEPCYDVGGDAYDYAVDDQIARFMVFDAMGRGLKAGLTCTAALAATRAARRDGRDLSAMARAADAALQEQFADLRFVTGVLAELDLDTGVLRYLNAGHPPPILLRQGKAVRALRGGRRLPLGIEDDGFEVGAEVLEPGDRLLLYTDGITEAYDRSGERFGLDRLTDLATQGMNALLPAPETLRRLAHTVLEHQGGRPSDDATLMIVEWSADAAERTQP